MTRAEIEALPRIMFRCERDWMSENRWHIGIWWSRNFGAKEFELLYHHYIELRWTWPRVVVRWPRIKLDWQ